jgi:hypothetical protein
VCKSSIVYFDPEYYSKLSFDQKWAIMWNIAADIGYKLDRCPNTIHEFACDFLTEDLLGYRCIHCGFETVELPENMKK